MFNIETIEQLAKIEGENLVSLYLDLDRSKYSNIGIKDKVKDLLKKVEINDALKDDLSNKLSDFLSRVSGNTKSVAVFYSKAHWYPYVFSHPLDDFVCVDNFFDLEPLLFLLSENRNVAVLLINSEESRFLAVFLGNLEDHRHLEDRIIRKHKKGGWSQARFERKVDGEIKEHLKHSSDFLIRMDKIYKFDYIFLRSDSELENEFKNIVPKNILDKIRGDIKVDFNAPAEQIIGMVDRLTQEKVQEEENKEVSEITELYKNRHGENKIVTGIVEVTRALYDNKISKIIVNEEYSEPGFFCVFCGYIALSEEYCPYDQTPNSRTKNVVSVVLDQALAKGAKIEVLKNDAKVKELGEIVGILR